MNSRRLYVYSVLMLIIPATRCFALKRGLLRWCGAKIGNNVRIVSSARFQLSGKLTIEDDSWIGHDVLVVGGDAEVRIGEKVDLGPRVLIVTGSHEFYTSPDRAAGRGYSLPVSIEDGVWIGAASVLLGGVTVGRRSMVAAAALVNKDVESGSVVAGVPARMLQTDIGEGSR